MKSNIVVELLAHRYLYYVLSAPVITDREYDALEEKALKRRDAVVLLKPGSSLESSYDEATKNLAMKMRSGEYKPIRI
jgi:NAD-dependent DNA ligase